MEKKGDNLKKKIRGILAICGMISLLLVQATQGIGATYDIAKGNHAIVRNIVIENGRKGQASSERELANTAERELVHDYDSVSHNSKFSGTTHRKGIDVSHHNGKIDWEKVKADGIEFAFIRVAYRSIEEGNLGYDKRGKENLLAAKKAGLRVGAYIFSQAISQDEAVEEANYAIGALEGVDLDLPLVIDYEFATYKDDYGNNQPGRLNTANLSKETATSIVNAFNVKVESFGYIPMLYADKNMLTNHLLPNQLRSRVWLAHYISNRGGTTNYNYDYTFWQFTSQGTCVEGVYSSYVDLVAWYDNGEALYSHYNGFKQHENGDWYYYKNGVVDGSFTGLAEQAGGGWYFARNGIIDWNYTGLAKTVRGDWYYVKNGMFDSSFTGLCQYGNDWYYIYNGVLQWEFYGFVQHTNGVWYYVERGRIYWEATGVYDQVGGSKYFVNKGVLDFSYTGLAQTYNLEWYYVNCGSVDLNHTGLVKYNSDWFYVENGKLNWNFDGFKQHTDGNWYYLEKSKIQFGTTGLRSHVDGTLFYIKNGMVDWRYSGLAKDLSNDWYYVENAQINNKFTGLYCYNKSWYYVSSGKLDWTFSGFVHHTDGNWYYVVQGKIDFLRNGLAKDSFGNWYYIQNGMYVPSYTGLVQYQDKFYYVENGTINWKYDGFVQYSDTRWYLVQGGIVMYKTGVFKHIDENFYYAKDGRIDWNYSGQFTGEDGKVYTIENGWYNKSVSVE